MNPMQYIMACVIRQEVQFTWGWGSLISVTEKINTKISTEVELVGVSNYVP